MKACFLIDGCLREIQDDAKSRAIFWSQFWRLSNLTRPIFSPDCTYSPEFEKSFREFLNFAGVPPANPALADLREMIQLKKRCHGSVSRPALLDEPQEELNKEVQKVADGLRHQDTYPPSKRGNIIGPGGHKVGFKLYIKVKPDSLLEKNAFDNKFGPRGELIISSNETYSWKDLYSILKSRSTPDQVLHFEVHVKLD